MTITTDEAAALTGRSAATIRSWVLRGKLTPARRGAKPLRFAEADVIEAEYASRTEAERQRLDELSRRFLAAG